MFLIIYQAKYTVFNYLLRNKKSFTFDYLKDVWLQQIKKIPML